MKLVSPIIGTLARQDVGKASFVTIQNRKDGVHTCVHACSLL